MIEDIKVLLDAGYKDIRFEDDNFFVNIKRVSDFCDLIFKNSLKFTWLAFSRADYLSKLPDELLSKVRKAGCNEIFVGV